MLAYITHVGKGDTQECRTDKGSHQREHLQQEPAQRRPDCLRPPAPYPDA